MDRLAVRLDHVYLRYSRGRRVGVPRFTALHDINFDLNHGDKLGVVGRNGAGKSTLLRVIADVLEPDEGAVVRSHGPCQLLALGLGFLSHLSGRNNAILSGMLQGFDRASMDAKLDSIKEFAEIGEFFDQPISTYSSGMRARLGFAIALQSEPDILLIDETLSVGDAEFRAKSRNALRNRLSSDTTVVLVSHDERVIGEACDRVLWMERGRIVMSGSTAEVLEAYASGTVPVTTG